MRAPGRPLGLRSWWLTQGPGLEAAGEHLHRLNQGIDLHLKMADSPVKGGSAGILRPAALRW